MRHKTSPPPHTPIPPRRNKSANAIDSRSPWDNLGKDHEQRHAESLFGASSPDGASVDCLACYSTPVGCIPTIVRRARNPARRGGCTDRSPMVSWEKSTHHGDTLHTSSRTAVSAFQADRWLPLERTINQRVVRDAAHCVGRVSETNMKEDRPHRFATLSFWSDIAATSQKRGQSSDNSFSEAKASPLVKIGLEK